MLHDQLPATRADARSCGHTFYFTGKACIRGHVAPRYVVTKNCVECTAENGKRRNAEEREHLRESKRSWSSRNPHKNSEYKKRRYAKCLEENRAWRKANPEKASRTKPAWIKANQDAVRGYARKWAANNKPYCRGNGALYRARKRNATPVWANIQAIMDFYAICPEGYEVDHAIPLAGELVCGLHVVENLQYLTPTANRSKGNRFEMAEAMPEAA